MAKKFMLEHFTPSGEVLLHHQLTPRFTMAIFYDDDGDYNLGDTFDRITVNGVIVTGVVVDSPEFDIEGYFDYGKIRNLIKRGLHWYKGNVIINPPIKEDYQGDRYRVTKSKDNNCWVLADTHNHVVITWNDGDFNGTQKITPLYDGEIPIMSLPTILREAGDFLVNYHSEKI